MLFRSQFWGMFGRNAGVLTYLSLTFLILASAMIQDLKNYVLILRVFLMVSFFETVYAFIQIGKQDPLNWSIFDIFGTLGNANFLSAFLGMSSLVTASLILVKKNQIANRIFLIIFLSLFQCEDADADAEGCGDPAYRRIRRCQTSKKW